MHQEIREILLSVRNPCRYVGGEVGSRKKLWDAARVRFCLAFPDTYEIGMSHLGLSILYHVISEEPTMLAERVFAPWGDMEAELLRCGMPLFSLESHRPVGEFDIVGFSLCYELSFTNVLAMLGLSGIPPRAVDRIETSSQGSNYPLIIAGGPCAYNPMPMSPFFDAMVIGDGERAILDIGRVVAKWKVSGLPRLQLLEELSCMQGVFVPMLHVRDAKPAFHVGRAIVPDLDSTPYPSSPIVPHMAIQERTAVEVSRGCARGCRFCQAGYIYRPVRQRSSNTACGLAVSALKSGGGEEFSFLSLSIGDWPPLEEALGGVHGRCGAMLVNATLPSLRAESLTPGVMVRLGAARAGSFTLAPEAGTERMRHFINKGNTDDDLYASVEQLFRSGWHAIKLYFMIGLPGETAEDIDGICRIANRCLDVGRRYHRRPDVTVSTSTFVPKAHTPLQWERQISTEEVRELQRQLKKRLRRPGLYYRWHNAEMSFIEGVFARGGRELAAVIEMAVARGARFDGWDECFEFGRWCEAFAEVGIKPASYLSARGLEEPFPWDFLQAGPSRDFLLRERKRAYDLVSTPDCTVGECSRCGLCDFQEVKNKKAPEGEIATVTEECGIDEGCERPKLQTHRYRLRYAKKGRAVFLGAIETLDAIRRAVRASGLPLIYSEGYHPRPKISASPAPPMGIESDAEYLDIDFSSDVCCDEVIHQLIGRLPDGMEVLEAVSLGVDAMNIDSGWLLAHYEVDFSRVNVDIDRICREFVKAPSFKVTRIRGNKFLEVDLKEHIAVLDVPSSDVLRVALCNKKPLLRIGEIITWLGDFDEAILRAVRIRKTDVSWGGFHAE